MLPDRDLPLKVGDSPFQVSDASVQRCGLVGHRVYLDKEFTPMTCP